MKRILTLAALAFLAARPAAADSPGDEKLVSVAGRDFGVELVGSTTFIHCPPKDKSEDCRWIEKMELTSPIPWDDLLEKARKAQSVRKGTASGTFAQSTLIDQHGGPWTVTLITRPAEGGPDFLKPFSCRLKPDFQGYDIRVGAEGQILSTDVVVKSEDWKDLRKKLGLDAAKKKGWLQRVLE